MTRVEFYFNVTDKPAKIAELCEKAIAKHRQLTLFASDETWLAELQQQLWGGKAESFLPVLSALDQNAPYSPIVLETTGEQLLQDDILINLNADYPPFFSRFRYLVELVGDDEQDKAAARQRFKFYRDRGYQIKSTDAAQS